MGLKVLVSLDTLPRSGSDSPLPSTMSPGLLWTILVVQFSSTASYKKLWVHSEECIVETSCEVINPWREIDPCTASQWNNPPAIWSYHRTLLTTVWSWWTAQCLPGSHPSRPSDPCVLLDCSPERSDVLVTGDLLLPAVNFLRMFKRMWLLRDHGSCVTQLFAKQWNFIFQITLEKMEDKSHPL